MRKVFLTLLVALISICSYAQVKGDKYVGVNLSYATEISNIGLGVKGQYNFTDAIRGEAAFDYFLKKDGLKMWDINANVHYLIPVADKIKFYPLAGVSFTNWSNGFSIEDEESHPNTRGWNYDENNSEEDEDYEASSSLHKFGVNLGAGVSYELTEKLVLNFEIKYQLISDYNQAVFGVGVAYKF